MTVELQFSQLSWANFEELIAALARDVDRLVDVRRYGPDGQSQDGVDVIGFTRTGRNAYAYQCKRVRKFTESDLSRAVAEFANGARPFTPVRFVVVVAVSGLRKQVLHTLEAERARNSDFELILWDATDLSNLLRERPRIVETFFGKDTASRFCLSGAFSTAASPDDVCPYPGLAPFNSDQSQWFLGEMQLLRTYASGWTGFWRQRGH